MGKQQTNIKEKGRVSLKEPRRYQPERAETL